MWHVDLMQQRPSTSEHLETRNVIHESFMTTSASETAKVGSSESGDLANARFAGLMGDTTWLLQVVLC